MIDRAGGWGGARGGCGHGLREDGGWAGCDPEQRGAGRGALGLGVGPRNSWLWLQVACLQFDCDEVVSLVQKLCESFGAVDLPHDKASVAWVCAFLQMRVKELEDKVTRAPRACGCLARPA